MKQRKGYNKQWQKNDVLQLFADWYKKLRQRYVNAPMAIKLL